MTSLHNNTDDIRLILGLLDAKESGQVVSSQVQRNGGAIALADLLDDMAAQRASFPDLNRRLGLPLDAPASQTSAAVAARLAAPVQVPGKAYIDPTLKAWPVSLADPDKALARLAKALRAGEAIPTAVRTGQDVQPIGEWLDMIALWRDQRPAPEAAVELGAADAGVSGTASMVRGRLRQAGLIP